MMSWILASVSVLVTSLFARFTEGHMFSSYQYMVLTSLLAIYFNTMNKK